MSNAEFPSAFIETCPICKGGKIESVTFTKTYSVMDVCISGVVCKKCKGIGFLIDRGFAEFIPLVTNEIVILNEFFNQKLCEG